MSVKITPQCGLRGESFPDGGHWDFCFLRGNRKSPLLMYDIPLNVTEECLPGEPAFSSNNDFLRSMLINEGASGRLQSRYELTLERDLLARGRVFFYIENVFGDTIRETYSSVSS